MFEFLDPILQLGWRDWATIVGVLFGVVSTIAYFDQRRSARQNADISKFLRRHVSKDISEETIRELEKQRLSMEEQVNSNIPKLARRAVLREQAQAHADAVAKHFSEWRKLQHELKTDAAEGDIDPAIQTIILDRILPLYEKATRVDQLKTRTTILSVAVAISGVALPSIISWFISPVLAVPLVTTLIQLAKETSDPSQFQRATRATLLALIGVAGALATMAAAIFLAPSTDITPTGRALGWILAVTGPILFAAAIVVHFAARRRTQVPG